MRVVVLLGIFCLVGHVCGTVSFPPLVTVDEEALASWSDEIEKAAEEAVRSINEMHVQQRGKEDQVAMGVDGLQGIFELEEVPLESARAAPGVVYEAIVQMKQIDATHKSRRVSNQLQFVQPLGPLDPLWSIRGLQNSFNALPSHPSQLPEFPQIEFEGPMDLRLKSVVHDIEVRTPRALDVGGGITRLILKEGARINISGISEIGLHNYLDLVHSNIDNKKGGSPIQIPELYIKIGKGSKLKLSSIEANVKVRRYGNSLELIQKDLVINEDTSAATPKPQQKESSGTELVRQLIEKHERYILSGDSIREAIKQALNKLAHPEGAEGQTVPERVISGKAEAATLLLIPLQLKHQETGVVSSWHIVAARGEDGTSRVVSHQPLPPVHNAVGVAPLALFNSTVHLPTLPNYNSV